MRLTCTACGAHGSIEQFTADGDARRFAELIATLPAGIAPVAIRYLGLFRPVKRGLSWDRAVRLIAELADSISSGHVERHGRRLSAAPALYMQAMQQMLDGRERLDLPLQTHGYLLAIIAGASPKAEAREETAQEALKRSASTLRHGSRSRAIAELSSEIARRKRFGEREMTPEEQQNFIARQEAGE
ncbi:MAG: hypothetical protein M0P19_06060 [Nevskia sp.]|nr:hypothetical protein [Nevskia sp.]MCK9385075.1 hypothetical protein [Nevskia sp.]